MNKSVLMAEHKVEEAIRVSKADTPLMSSPPRPASVTRNECAVPGSRKPDAEARLVEVSRTWVGDIHQPLHVSFEDDRGGNSVLVTGLCDANLHSAWDACLVLKSGDRRGLCRGEHPRNRVSGSRICSMQLWASRCRATGRPHAESAFTRIAASLRGSGGR